MRTPDDIKRELITRIGWSQETLDLWIRARFRCEYCDQDLLESVDDYFFNEQCDHIIPRSKGGEEDTPDNLAIVCKTCNALKRAWDPRAAGVGRSPRDYIGVVRGYIRTRRAEKQIELRETRELASQLLAALDGESGPATA